jgi:hypothetical protein
VIDGLEVNDDERWHLAGCVRHIATVHYESTTIEESGATAVYDYNSRAMGRNRVFDLRTPDGVTSEIHLPNDEPANRAEALS